MLCVFSSLIIFGRVEIFCVFNFNETIHRFVLKSLNLIYWRYFGSAFTYPSDFMLRLKHYRHLVQKMNFSHDDCPAYSIHWLVTQLMYCLVFFILDLLEFYCFYLLGPTCMRWSCIFLMFGFCFLLKTVCLCSSWIMQDLVLHMISIRIVCWCIFIKHYIHRIAEDLRSMLSRSRLPIRTQHNLHCCWLVPRAQFHRAA